MKIRKEAVILGVVIVALSLYLIFNEGDRSLYELPNLDPIPVSEISKISLESSEDSILFSQKTGEWVMNEEAYPVDKNAIKRVLDIVANLRLTTLISESQNYERYDLDPNHKISIMVWAGDKLVREFDVGKAASGHRHTFVKLAGDPRVYHAGESFRNRVQGKVDQFRDKTVLSFETGLIEQVQISSREGQGAFVKVKPPESSGETALDGDQQPMGEAKPVWKNMTGDVVKDNTLTKLLDDFSSLKCSAFMYELKKDDFRDPIVTAVFKGAQELTLHVFEPLENDASRYPAVSSQNDDAFFIPKWQADQLTKALTEIVPIEKDNA